jgi:hypothetical protein
MTKKEFTLKIKFKTKIKIYQIEVRPLCAMKTKIVLFTFTGIIIIKTLVINLIRFNLSQDVDIDLNEETKELILTIINCTFLTESERKLTNLYKINDNFNVKQKEEEATTVVSVKLPDKVILESIDRRNIDTEFGWLLEVSFEKKQEINKSKLMGRRMAHMNTTVQTLVNLQHNMPIVTEGENVNEK